jgi:hypothetical protein
MAGAPTARRNGLAEIANNLSHQAGAHAIRIGADFLYNNLYIDYPRAARGTYSFSSLTSFQQGLYNNAGFTQTFGPSSVSQTNPNLGVYIQDEWKLSSRFTLNIGLRYDLQFIDSIATDTNNLAPRAGFAWTPTASRSTVVRGSFGLFYDRIPLRAVANALLSKSQITVSLSPTQVGAPAFPNILAAIPSGVLPNISTMDPHMRNAYSEQGSIEVEQQIGSRTTVSAGYQHLRGLHLIASINQNVPACVASGANNACRPNPKFANISQYSAAADSRYDGLHVSFIQRPTRWGSYRVSYTYSKALDNVGEFFFSSPIDMHNIWLDWARSDDDQRHRVVATGTLHTRVADITAIAQYYSALPLNLTTGANTIQGTPARPVVNGTFISRNAGTGADFVSVGTRVSRSWTLHDRLQMEAIAEAFNALNHRNDLTYNGVLGSPTYGQATAVNDPRSLQFALRFKF